MQIEDIEPFPAEIIRQKPVKNKQKPTKKDDAGMATQYGSVKWFNKAKGFGFITSDEGKDLFVHYTGIVGEGFRELSDGQRVSFDAKLTDKGYAATNVCVIVESE